MVSMATPPTAWQYHPRQLTDRRTRTTRRSNDHTSTWLSQLQILLSDQYYTKNERTLSTDCRSTRLQGSR
jgi:hypothetical protein